MMINDVVVVVVDDDDECIRSVLESTCFVSIFIVPVTVALLLLIA
jgi:hypothetical protein